MFQDFIDEIMFTLRENKKIVFLFILGFFVFSSTFGYFYSNYNTDKFLIVEEKNQNNQESLDNDKETKKVIAITENKIITDANVDDNKILGVNNKGNQTVALVTKLKNLSGKINNPPIYPNNKNPNLNKTNNNNLKDNTYTKIINEIEKSKKIIEKVKENIKIIEKIKEDIEIIEKIKKDIEIIETRIIYNTEPITLKEPDGTITITKPDSTIITTEPDGTITITKPDSTIITTEPDGTITITEPDGTTIITEPDGTITIIEPDSTIIITEPDGTITITEPDGTTIITEPDGTITITEPDGTTIITEPDGTLTVTEPDSTIIITELDGTITITEPDGTITIVEPDSTITESDGIIAPDDIKEYFNNEVYYNIGGGILKKIKTLVSFEESPIYPTPSSCPSQYSELGKYSNITSLATIRLPQIDSLNVLELTNEYIPLFEGTSYYYKIFNVNGVKNGSVAYKTNNPDISYYWVFTICIEN